MADRVNSAAARSSTVAHLAVVEAGKAAVSAATMAVLAALHPLPVADSIMVAAVAVLRAAGTPAVVEVALAADRLVVAEEEEEAMQGADQFLPNLRAVNHKP